MRNKTMKTGFLLAAAALLTLPGMLTGQQWRTQATSRLQAARYLTNETAGVICLHPESIVQSSNFRELPLELRIFFYENAQRLSVIGVEPARLNRMLVFLEPFSIDQWNEWFNDDSVKSGWQMGRLRYFSSMPDFVGIHLTFEEKEIADKFVEGFARDAEKKSIGDQQVLVNRKGKSPTGLLQSEDGKQVLLANESRMKRMLNTKNSNPEMDGLIRRVWRPYQQFALFTDAGVKTGLAQWLESLESPVFSHLANILNAASTLRIELNLKEILVVGFDTPDADRQVRIGQELASMREKAAGELMLEIGSDPQPDDYGIVVANRILTDCLNRMDQKKTTDNILATYKIPRSIRSLFSDVQRPLSGTVRNGRKKASKNHR